MSHNADGLFSKKRPLAQLQEEQTLEDTKINQMVATLTQVSAQFKTIKFDQLQQQRETNGFNHFIFDLKDPAHNANGEGWSLHNGMLHVDYTHFKNTTTTTQVHDFLNNKLGDRPWFQSPNGSNNLNGHYNIDIKTLGKNGVNAAIDPILLLQGNDGSVGVLSGQRPVCNEYCLPGGMNESTVINTCITELLEECFSGALFEPNAASSERLDVLSTNIVDLNKYIEDLCPSELKESIASLPATAIPASIAVQNALERIQNSELDAGKKAPLIAKIKCKLYEKYLPEQYIKFAQFINDNIDQTQANVLNASDPRNTDAAYMETKPLPIFLDKQVFIEYVTNECALNFKAGDDLGNVKVRDITVFCGQIASTGMPSDSEQQGAHCDHASLVLDSIALGVESKRLTLTNALTHQIQSIIDNHPSLTISQEEETSMPAKRR